MVASMGGRAGSKDLAGPGDWAPLDAHLVRDGRRCDWEASSGRLAAVVRPLHSKLGFKPGLLYKTVPRVARAAPRHTN